MKLVTALAGAWEDFTLVNKYMVLGDKGQRRAKINIPNPGGRAQRCRGVSNWTASPEGAEGCHCRRGDRRGCNSRGARRARDRRARGTEGSIGAQRGLSQAKVVASAHWEQGLGPAPEPASRAAPSEPQQTFCWPDSPVQPSPAIDLLSPSCELLPCFLSRLADGSWMGYL